MSFIYEVPLDLIETVQESEINLSRLKSLTSGSDTFNKAMTNRSEPITLDGDDAPPLGKGLLKIIDGRHRLIVCQRRGVTHVPAQVFVTRKKVGIHLCLYAHMQCQERFGPMGGTREGYESLANTLVKRVRYKVIQFERGREGDKKYLNVKFDWEIDAEARNDLSLVGPIYGRFMHGSLIA